MGSFERNLTEPGKLPLLLCLLAFVVTFLVTRTITRTIRAGRGPFHDVQAGGVHLHHSIPGLLLLLLGAVVSIGAPPAAPWRHGAAVLVGIGASLVLDEFALILHLDDVYWSEEGRVSVQAIGLAVACLALPLVGVVPFGVNDLNVAEVTLRTSGSALLVLTMMAVVVCAVKGKYRIALLSVFLPFVAFVCAVRLARPHSLWDTRRYAEHPAKRARAAERARRFDAKVDPAFRRLGDLLAGKPTGAAP